MIDKILALIRKEVNDYINKKIGGTPVDNRVLLTSFVNDEGKVGIPQDSVGLGLLNIEEEKYLKTTGLMQTQKAENMSYFVNPPVSINLQIIFAAYFNQYEESLKHISYILSCFQTKPVFDIENTPSMSTLDISKLLFELNTLGLEQQHYIWTMIGLRYLPSIIFKVRLVVVYEKDIVKTVPNIKEIKTDPNLKEVND